MGDLVTVVILERPVTFRQFNDTQLVLMHRMRQVLNGAIAQMPASDDDAEPTDAIRRAMDMGMGTVAQFLTMIEGMTVDELDQRWLVDQMLAGHLDLAEIAKFVETMVPADKAPKKPTKKAVRAR